jgi:hypothetical protein
MAVVAMSETELARVGVLGEFSAGRLSADHAATLMGVSRRQAFRLLRRLREGGASALASRRRGQPGNRRLPESVRAMIMTVGGSAMPTSGRRWRRRSLPGSMG